MATWQIIALILLVIGVIASNIMLLKYSAKFELKSFNQDPIEKAKQNLAKKRAEDEGNVEHKEENKKGDE